MAFWKISTLKFSEIFKKTTTTEFIVSDPVVLWASSLLVKDYAVGGFMGIGFCRTIIFEKTFSHK